MRYHSETSAPRGQTLVIVAIGMVVLIGMVGVVIDVGLQWGANRGAQNASDASAEAGAIVLMEWMLGAPRTDADVRDAVDDAATTNSIEVEAAEYTDWQGNPLNVDVGSGGGIPTGAQGVRVVGTRVHETVFAKILGVNELEVFTDAIAVTGPTEPCPPGGPCALLPVTVPTTVVTCDGQNRSEVALDPVTNEPLFWQDGEDYTIPLCGNNPGSVGWIDWTPPAGGNSELAGQLCEPDPIGLDLPDWYYVTSTGNTNSSQVQDCFEKWIGSVILIPLFEDTCRDDPGEEECADEAPVGGLNQWYYFPQAAAILLTGVYIDGNHADTCDSGNGATSCFTGQFVDASIEGEVGAWIPDDTSVSQFFSVQLIH